MSRSGGRSSVSGIRICVDGAKIYLGSIGGYLIAAAGFLSPLQIVYCGCGYFMRVLLYSMWNYGKKVEKRSDSDWIYLSKYFAYIQLKLAMEEFFSNCSNYLFQITLRVFSLSARCLPHYGSLCKVHNWSMLQSLFLPNFVSFLP